MVKIAGVIALFLLAFVAGIYYERLDPSEVGNLNQKIEELEAQLSAQRDKNEDLKDTLDLVKRQIQTDRVAYQELQQMVEGSGGERAELRKQIEDQQKLLAALREKLENSEN